MPPLAEKPAEPCKAPDVGQTDFTAALIDPRVEPPAGVVGPDGKRADKRFNVYRNNVTVSLVNALGDIFPAVRRLVGETFFNAMARAYVRTDPPTSPLLFRYGRGFPDFLETFGPASDLPYLPDVARLERAWLDAYHAADVAPLPAEALGAVRPEDLAALRLRPHPAAAVVRSPFAAVSIFSANRKSEPPPAIDPGVAEDGVVTRPGSDVIVTRLPRGAAVFFGALMDGQTLGEAADAAVAAVPDFDLAAAISAMLESGVFAGLAGTEMPNNGG